MKNFADLTHTIFKIESINILQKKNIFTQFCYNFVAIFS